MIKLQPVKSLGPTWQGVGGSPAVVQKQDDLGPPRLFSESPFFRSSSNFDIAEDKQHKFIFFNGFRGEQRTMYSPFPSHFIFPTRTFTYGSK